MDYEFESIIPWNGEHDTGRDARQKLDRNFAKIKANFQELAGTTFVTTAFFARIFGIDGEDGAQVDINDTEAVITAVKVKFGLYSESYVSAKGKNPDAGSEVSGATTLAALTDVSITTTPKDGQVLAYDITLNKWTPVDMEATAGIDEEELLQILTQKGYATQQWVTQQSYAKTSVRIKAGTGLTGGGTLAQDVTLSLATVGTAGTYTKVTVDAYGRVTGHASLAAGDIPALAISKITGLQAALDAKMDAADFEELFEKVYVSGYGYAIRAKLALYTDSWMSAKGSNPDAGGVSAGLDEEQLAEYLTTNHYAKTTDIPSLDGYATQEWVQQRGYLDADDRADFLRYVDTVFADADTLYDKIGIRSFSGCFPDSLPVGNRWYNYGEVISFPVPNGMRFDLYANHHSSSSLNTDNRNGLMFRTGFHNNTLNGWRMILDKVNYNGYIETLDNLTHAVASDYIQVGSARLRYDSATGALYVQKSDGTACGFYATGFLSTKGSNPDAGSVVTGGIDEEELAEYLTTHGYATQAWVNNQGFLDSSALSGYATQQWVNSQGFAKDVKWSNLAGRPAPLANDQYYYGHGQLATDFNDAVKGGAYFTASETWPSNGPGTSYRWGALAVFHTGTDNTRVAQLWISHDTSSAGGVYVRMKYESSDGDWRAWRRLLDDACITDYTVTKTGGGASGTWGIAVTGNAGSATRLQTARTLWGQSFNGTENVSGDMTGVGNISASGTVYANAFRLNNSKGRFFYDESTNAVWLQGGAGLNMGISNHAVGTIPTLTVHADVMHIAGGMYADNYLQVGSARLQWDSTNNALYVQKSDGTQCGFYATGFVSAKGANADAGSAVASVTELSELDDVVISNPVDGQTLIRRNGVWKNETVSGGGGVSSVAWGDITGKPTWIGSSKPSYTWSEIGRKPTWIGSSKPAYSFSEITGTPSLTVSSSSGTNLTVNVEGASKSVTSLYATYLGGTTKQGLFTGMTYSGNKLSVTVGGTTRSVTINAGGDETDHFMSRGRVYDLDAVNQSGVAYVNNPSNLPDGAYQWGFVATFLSSEGDAYGFQIYVGDGTGRGIYVRTRYGGAWKGWNKYMPAS